MAAPFDNIVQHLFHQPSLHSVTVDELQHMTQQHPYFAAAHFLLLKKMQVTEHPSFTDQLHRTALYFNNPLWLQFLLQPETTSSFTVADKAPFIDDQRPENNTAAANSETPKELNEPLNDYDITDAGETHQPAIHNEHPSDIVQHGSMMDIITAVFNEPAATQDAAISKDSDEISQESNENNSTHVDTNETATQADEGLQTDQGAITIDNGAINEELSPVYDEEARLDNPPDTIVSDQPVSLPVHADAPHMQEDKTTEDQPASVDAPGTTAATENAHGAIENKNVAHHEPARVGGAEDHDATDAPSETGEDGLTQGGPIINEQPLLKIIIETPGAKDDLLFEPYHTVDYFASQGIKLSKQEIDSKDKLGRQLKSFTDWLKTMKKLPQVSIDKILSENEESKVVEDAIHSIENKEVITEAMAEVFEKQGMNGKAAEIYQKLSLLNPSKSAYFAARADALKQ